MKVCTKCKKPKQAKKFIPRPGYQDGLQSVCRDCLADYKKYWQKTDKGRWSMYFTFIKRAYNLSKEDYEKLAAKAKGCCQICGKKSKRRLDVDHDHVTKRVRGLLCNSCNIGIGKLKHSVEILEAAIQYLKTETPKEGTNG